MVPVLSEVASTATPECLAEQLRHESGFVLLRSALSETDHARYSLVSARPFLNFRCFGSRCLLWADNHSQTQFGNPWSILHALMARYEVADPPTLPFPLGACFGFWGYDLKRFVEPKLSCRATNDLFLPECALGFYDSLVVFDHAQDKTWVISTGMRADGSRDDERARDQLRFWSEQLANSVPTSRPVGPSSTSSSAPRSALAKSSESLSNLSREEYLARVRRAQAYIRSGDIYQVNLSHRLALPCPPPSWELFRNLSLVSPAPFAAYLNCGTFQLASSSPELFLRLSGFEVITRPIKGTRPRSRDPIVDAQLRSALQSSPKEQAELVMITDLLRNDLGRFCEFGSVQVTDLARLESFPQVHHLVSTVRGRLRSGVSHATALASAFPGGSITGAPKFRAMEIIDELEPVARGPYTGSLGYLGFNRESQLSIIIRAAVCTPETTWFNVGAGIVADSVPEAEYEETLAKAAGFLATIGPGAGGDPPGGEFAPASRQTA